MTSIISLIFVLIVFIIVCKFNKGGNKLLEEKPEKIISFEIEKSLKDCFGQILDYSKSSDYIVEAIDEKKYRIVLGENMTMTTNGFFFPIYLDEINENNTRIEIGIKSKTFQVGPAVEKRHKKFVNDLKLILL